MKQTVVPSGTGNGSTDIVPVIYSILLFPVLLFSFLFLFLIVGRVKIPGTNWKQWRNVFQWVGLPGTV